MSSELAGRPTVPLAIFERSAAKPSTAPRAAFRPEIQGLRAVAVVAVVVFHLRPWMLPGGFVGVDVFFVISGYLISDLLLREIEATGRVSIRGFYARRVKRLLPIASVVLVVVAACVGFLPVARWRATAEEIAASALYYQNWLLAERAKDYFSHVGDLAPLRHYWSLSLEEQYCILWPLPLLIGGALGVFRDRPRRSFGFVAASVGLASFAWSIDVTLAAPRAAYFSTAARIWEFAIGALLASFAGWQEIGGTARNALGWIGLALIAFAAFTFDQSVHFPGYAALVPTVGAALVLMSGGATSLWSPNRVLEIAPAQYIGDLSYSLYLWHWPVFVFLRWIGTSGGGSETLFVLLISTALAHQSKNLIEDPFRRATFAARHPVQPFLLAAGLILLVGLATAWVRARADRESSPPGYREWVGSADYPGARALTERLLPQRHVRFVPRPVDAFADQRNERPPDRWVAEKPASPLAVCQCGDPASATHVVVIGDSHAEQWFPALAEIAEHRRWRLSAITRSCAFADAPTLNSDDLPDETCRQWNTSAMQKLEEAKPSVVLIAQSAGHRLAATKRHEEDARRIAPFYEKRWKDLQQRGMKIVVFRDTPVMNAEIPDCVSSFNGRLESCSRPREAALRRFDPILLAAARTPGVEVIDMTDAICGPDTCAPVVGNVLVYRDSHHLTASYARTIAPFLEKAVVPLVEGSG
jgi:peptidoglycan/LPS O-acetylase OafA/YrhL